METELDKIKEKIIKMLSIADDDSASDNEVYVAVQKAQKLMTAYNISRKDIMVEKDKPKDIESYYFDKMNPKIYIPIMDVIANNFGCEMLYKAYRQNAYFILYGHCADLEITVEIMNKVIAFLKLRLNKYVKQYKKDFKIQCEVLLGMCVAKADSRVIKRSYCQGFSCGLSQKFEDNLLEVKKEYGDETALMVMGVPSDVKQHVADVVKPRLVKHTTIKVDAKAYADGRSDGEQFNA